MPAPTRAAGGRLAVLAFAISLSGASALIYQVLWLRLLGLVFGVTVYAASTVWASFMAGLAIGSLVAGRLADRVRYPLLWFAGAELGIALSAASTAWTIGALQRLYPTIAPMVQGSAAEATAIRFGLTFMALILPTALMGATLPFVVRAPAARARHLGNALSLLYGSNTAGAIAGALVSGIILIPQLGMRYTFQVAAALNLCAAITAIALTRQTRTALSPASDEVSPVQPLATTTAARTIVLATFALSGGVALALEVIWLRAAIIILGPTVYTVSGLLAAVLAGIALGSFLIGPLLPRLRQPLLMLAALEGGIAVAIATSLSLLTMAGRLTAAIGPWMDAWIPPYLIPVLVGSIAVATPTSILMGAAFPLGLQLWTAGPDDTTRAGSRIGRFYALNVFGGIAGSLLAGFVMLPVLGTRASMIALAVLTWACSAALSLCVAGRWRVAVAASALATVAVVAIAGYRGADPIASLLAQRLPYEPVIWREEGVQTTASVHAWGPRLRSMHLDGYHQAGDDGAALSVHYKIGTLPVALHSNPHDALIVGLGGGSTAGAMSRYSRLNVDVIELSDTVVRASAFFEHVNFKPLSRPNVHLRLDDGRNYLASTKRRYDIITADTIQPVRAGSASLYSAEYFRLVSDRLNDDGIVLQWFSGTSNEYRLVARTFSSVFPYVTAWDDGTLLVGTKRPLKLSPDAFNWKLQVPELRDMFSTVGIRSFADLVALFKAGPAELKPYVGSGMLLTDDRPILEYFLALPRGTELDVAGLKGDPRQIVGERSAAEGPATQ